MAGKIRDESLEADELGKLEILARARRRALRRHYGRRGVKRSWVSLRHKML